MVYDRQLGSCPSILLSEMIYLIDNSGVGEKNNMTGNGEIEEKNNISTE